MSLALNKPPSLRQLFRALDRIELYEDSNTRSSEWDKSSYNSLMCVSSRDIYIIEIKLLTVVENFEKISFSSFQVQRIRNFIILLLHTFNVNIY